MYVLMLSIQTRIHKGRLKSKATNSVWVTLHIILMKLAILSDSWGNKKFNEHQNSYLFHIKVKY